MKLLIKKPILDGVAMDLHPGYDTRKIAQDMAKEFSTPIFEVQHDWAHAVSLLVDNNLDQSIVLTLDYSRIPSFG